jgi:hypothetical protein
MHTNLARTTIYLSALCLTAFLAACGGQRADVANGNPTSTPFATEQAKAFSVEFKSEPAQIVAGMPADLIFRIKDKQGATVKDLQIVHEKPIHLIAVSTDLAEFYHIHPEVQGDGSCKVTHTFPNGGSYRLYADFTPKDSAQVVEQIDVKVEGASRPNTELVVDAKLEKSVDGLKVAMKPSADLIAGQQLTLDFQMFDAASGKPVADLQNYLGELAHFVLISHDLKDYVHVHPMAKGESMDAMNMGGEKPHGGGDDHSKSEKKDGADRWEVSAHTSFPRAGLYKIWAQFQRGGKVIAVPFIVSVREGETKMAEKTADVPSGAIRVTVSKDGFDPSSVDAKKGQPVRLAFVRTDSNNCAEQVVFSSLNIKKDLPVGKVVLVEFVPKDDREISFACGMGMLQGKVVLN